MELEDFLGAVDGVGFLLFAQVLALGGELLELEVGKASVFSIS